MQKSKSEKALQDRKVEMTNFTSADRIQKIAQDCNCKIRWIQKTDMAANKQSFGSRSFAQQPISRQIKY